MLAAGVALAACSCSDGGGKKAEEINDSTTPLHLLQPDYTTPYGALDTDSVRATVDRVFAYIDRVTPAKVVDDEGNTVTDLSRLPDDAKLNQGTFRLTSYEWGVMYKALLAASKLLDDPKYKAYVTDRIGFLANTAPAFAELAKRTGKRDGQMRMLVSPATLDDAGAMSGAFMETAMADSTLRLSEVIERYYAIVDSGTHRLSDGTIARMRPHADAVWLDDMFMALPAMATRTAYTGETRHLDEAARIAMLFIKRMWMPEKKLFRHGYVEGLPEQPSMAWGRANGWAILTLSQLLDALPESHPRRAELLDIYRTHIRNLADIQTKDGFWHQLLDRNDSYEETSATAIFAYCIAHGINNGWLDATAYGPVAHLAWEAVNSKVTPEGEVEGVCVGTGMGFDPAYYYYRPVSTKAAHGYGPVIWAGAEMIKLLNTYYPRVNDSAVHYYKVDPENGDKPIFSLTPKGKAQVILH